MITLRPYGDIEHMFDDVLVPVPAEASLEMPVDVYEEKGNVVVEASLPGIKPGDISVDVDEQLVVISGKREEVRESETNEYRAHEIRRGMVQRSIRLPAKVDEHAATARYEQGVLRLVLPKQA